MSNNEDSNSPLVAPTESRRKHNRVLCQWSARIQTTKKETITVIVRDVSLGGVGVLSPVQLPKGAKVLLECVGHLGSKRCDIRAICVVAFNVLKAPDYQIGLEFNSSIDPFRVFLVDYINAKSVG